jgi:6-phosphogluconate dehydrogenase
MADEKYKLGMIGLGTMGRNLLLNMADHDFPVSGYDKDNTKLDLLQSLIVSLIVLIYQG